MAREAGLAARCGIELKNNDARAGTWGEFMPVGKGTRGRVCKIRDIIRRRGRESEFLDGGLRSTWFSGALEDLGGPK